MNRVAIVDHFFFGRFGEEIAKALGPDAVFYCSSQYAEDHAQTIEDKKRAGVDVVVDNYNRAWLHKVFLLDHGYRLNVKHGFKKELLPITEALDKRKARMIHYCHHTGLTMHPTQVGDNDYLLCPSEAYMASSVMNGKFICDKDGKPIMGKTVRGTEAVVSGLTHVDDKYLNLNVEQRKELQGQVAEKMGWKLNPELPLCLFLVEDTFNKSEMETAALALAKEVNLIIKDKYYRFVDVDGENIFHYSEGVATMDDDTFYTIRCAADATLTSFTSGGFITSVMMGLPTIPVFTTTIIRDNPPHPYNYTYFLRDFGFLHTQLAYWVLPLSLAAPEQLLRRIYDKEYWQRYARDIKTVQQSAFGDYSIGREAVKKAAFFIRRIMKVGSCAPSELPEGGGMRQGPLFRPPCPVAL